MNSPTFNLFTHIIEDDIDVVEEIERLLAENNLKEYCYFYDNPDIFLQNLNNDLSICVIDHRLPQGKTGLDLLKEVKAKSKHSYIIVFTGQADRKVVIEYLNNGADKYIDKNEKNHSIRLIEELKTGMIEVKERIEFINFQLALKAKTQEGQKKIDELMKKI